jgi:DNA-binding IclR family transcriptional regulator
MEHSLQELASKGGLMQGFQAIERAVQVLEAIGDASISGLRLSDVMRLTGLGRATSHRFLKSLADQGLVELDQESGRYFLGMKLLVLSGAASNRFGLARRAQPVLQRLAERTGDTIYLSLRIGDDAICLDRREGAFPIRTLTLKIGDRRPLGVGAGSLALLAFQPPAELQRIVAQQATAAAAFGFDQATLLSLAEAARAQGYAFNDQRLIPGMCAVGVPVNGRSGTPVAALSVAAIATRMEAPRRSNIVAWLREEATTLERDLGAILDHAGGPARAAILGTAI